MATVNVVPLSPGVRSDAFRPQRGGGGSRKGQNALGFAQLAAGQVEAGQDRQLRELALLLGAEQTQASLQVTREQLGQQGDQFSAQLEQIRSEGVLERANATGDLKLQLEGALAQVDAQVKAMAQGQAEELKRGDFDRRRNELAATITNVDRILGDKVAITKALGEREAQGVRVAVKTVSDGLHGRVVNLRTLMRKAASDNEITPSELDRLDSGLTSLINEATNTINDVDLGLDARTGVAFFLGAADQEGFTAMRHFGFELLELAATDGVTKSQSKRLEGMLDRILDYEEVALPEAHRITAAFEQELSRLSSGLDPLLQKSEIIEELVREQTEILGTQDVTARLDPRDPVDLSVSRDQAGQEQGLARLVERLQQSAAQPEPASPGALFPGDAGAEVRQRGLERRQGRGERSATREGISEESAQIQAAAAQAGEPFTFVGESLRGFANRRGQDVDDIGAVIRGMLSSFLGDTSQRDSMVSRIKELKAERDKVANKAKSGLSGTNIPLQEIQELSNIVDEIAALENMLKQGDNAVRERTGRNLTRGAGAKF